MSTHRWALRTAPCTRKGSLDFGGSTPPGGIWSTAPYSVLFGAIPQRKDFPHPPPGGRATTLIPQARGVATLLNLVKYLYNFSVTIWTLCVPKFVVVNISNGTPPKSPTVNMAALIEAVGQTFRKASVIRSHFR